MIAIGTRVKCIKRGAWNLTYLYGPGPAFGTVWTVRDIEPAYPGETPGLYLFLAEWDQNRKFNSRHFVHLNGNEDISELIAALNISNSTTGKDDIAVFAPRVDEPVTGQVGR
jgi:hypothetical protein